MSYETQLLQNLAAESDERTTALDEIWWDGIDGLDAYANEASRWALEDVGIDPAAPIRVRFEVCPLCDGRGRHVNPSIDAHGLTREDFDEDPDFAESYFRGDYDETCNLCRGEKVVPVPLDREVALALGMAAYERHQARAEMLAEMRVGA